MGARPAALHFTADPEANRLLAEEPLAVMLGMLLDQQVTMEWAFGAPLLLKQRLGVEHLDAAAIAAMDPEALEAVFRDKPALHRYPASMAKRAHDLCRHLVEHYDGRTGRDTWADAQSGEELLARVQALPGFGKDKSRIFVGLLGKRLGVQPRVGSRSRPTGPRSPTSTPSSACSRSARRSARPRRPKSGRAEGEVALGRSR